MGKELDAIRKKLGHLAMTWKPREYLDTGLPDLNRVIGHSDFGVPYGTMIEITGMECITGDSLIDCPRDLGKYPQGIPIKDLVGKTPWVYGFDQKLGRIALRKADKVWKVGKRPVYKVTFDLRGTAQEKFYSCPKSIKATVNHPFLLRKDVVDRAPLSFGINWNDDGYKALKDLEAVNGRRGDRLMPLFRKQMTKGYSGIHLNNGEVVHESRFILSEVSGEDRPYPEWDAHHKDENSLNNVPDNLEWKRHDQHKSDHLRKRNLEGTTGWQKTGVHPRGMLGKPQTEKQRSAARKTCVERNEKRLLNHRVEKIEFCGYEDVYDMSVPEINNFVANGVVVHNSHGKTAIALSLSALAQVGGARVVWGDLENSWDEKWSRARGLDPGKVELIQPYVGQFNYIDKKTGKVHQEKNPRLSTAQELCAEIEAVIKSPVGKKIAAKQIGVIDSIASLLTEGEGDAGIENANMRTNMDLPMFVGRLMRRWMACAQSYNTTFIFINQMRQKPGVKMGSPWYSPGGNAPRFYCQVRLRAKRTGFCKDAGKNVGIQGILKATKNKAGGEEGAEIGYRLLKGVLEFVPAKDVAYKKDGEE